MIKVCIFTLSLFLNAWVIVNAQGTWTRLKNKAPDPNPAGVMLLLTDGTVLCMTEGTNYAETNLFDKLTPDSNGSYVNGTWSRIAPMHYTRLFFSSQILMDGRVYVAGGEYGTGESNGETYNPLTNVWTMNPNIPSGWDLEDANSEILPNGKVLQAVVGAGSNGDLLPGDTSTTLIYDPAANTYTVGPSTHGYADESAWVKLPDNSILFPDMPYPNYSRKTSERYIPSLNQWVVDDTLPVQLYDPYGYELGPGFLLPDGRAFFVGSTPVTAYYTPTGNTSPGVWAAGPAIPNNLGIPDGAGAMMVNGKILLALSPTPTSKNHFPTPTYFYEFNYLTNTFTKINPPDSATAATCESGNTSTLDLPDGTVLFNFAQIGTDTIQAYYVYSPGGTPLASGKPTISSVRQIHDSLFTISGTLFNGISEGAEYGDDQQMATNYPIIRLTNGTRVYYARTFNWNSTGVQTGSQVDSTQFTLPAGLPAATYQLVVTANGISSNPISFTPYGSSTIAFNLKMFIQGYYQGSGLMTKVLYNEGVDPNPASTNVDTVTVSLVDSTLLAHDPKDNSSDADTVATAKGVLQTNGSLAVTFPASVAGNKYYLMMTHREAIQTWSAYTVTISNGGTYDFTSHPNATYGANVVDVYKEGIWSFYSGDMNQDQDIDIYDFPIYNLESSQFDSGYYVGDLNGDGNVDIYDFPVLDANSGTFIYSVHP